MDVTKIYQFDGKQGRNGANLSDSSLVQEEAKDTLRFMAGFLSTRRAGMARGGSGSPRPSYLLPVENAAACTAQRSTVSKEEVYRAHAL